MKPLLAVARIIDMINTGIANAMQWLSLLMVLLGAFNVITRYVGRAVGVSLGGTMYQVLQTYAFDLIFLLAAGWVLKNDGHVRVDIIYANLSARAKLWIDLIGTTLFLFPFTYMGFILSLPYVSRAWQRMEVNVNAGRLPVYLIKTVIPIAFALIALQGVSQLIKIIAGLRGQGPLAPTPPGTTTIPPESTAQGEAQ